MNALENVQRLFKSAVSVNFCLTQLNLRGWQNVSDWLVCLNKSFAVPCNLLIGKSVSPDDELRSLYAIKVNDRRLDNRTAHALKTQVLDSFRHQLMLGVPSIDDEKSLYQLGLQLKSKRLVVKLYLPAPIRYNFYLLKNEYKALGGFLGSNLTFMGMVEDESENFEAIAFEKYDRQFQERWNDRWCVDLSEDILKIIEASWARTEFISPYHIYLKVAYQLSQDAIAGISEFRIPHDLKDRLFDFQKSAVQIAAQYIQKRRGVLVGDVVGLGKTRIGAVLIRMFQHDVGISTLIICPPKLEKMWQSYIDDYGLTAKILTLSKVNEESLQEIPPRFRLILIDESQNLRNPKGKRYKALRRFILETDSRCMLLSATPYNKSFLDLSAQLGLFIPEDHLVGIRPEQLLKEIGGEIEFMKKHQCSVTSFEAFSKSNSPRDWQELMRLYMVRRTRKFIKENYAEIDRDGRAYLMSEGKQLYFPERIPKTCTFEIGSPTTDPYAKLYSDEVVEIINSLNLPRYGLANYISDSPNPPPNADEQEIIDDLSRAGKRLKGFCRTNLFKRLESSGEAFILSIKRHIHRNNVFLYALADDLDIPLGSQDAASMNTSIKDADLEIGEVSINDLNYRNLSAQIYWQYRTRFANKFKWIRSNLFDSRLATELREDVEQLEEILNLCPVWRDADDRKLAQLLRLLTVQHRTEKVLIFSQFADTVNFLIKQIQARGLVKSAAVTGDTDDPTELAWRFSPRSNNKTVTSELRILVSTDILSEGQNLQDCRIVVNYDLPWAIVRLIQRAGRVDRIGQEADKVLCYSFLPADGVEQIINLRGRLRERLRENRSVIGADDRLLEEEILSEEGQENREVEVYKCDDFSFIEDIAIDRDARILENLYTEKSGILDEEEVNDVDLTSEAYQVWKNATENNPSLRKKIKELPNCAYSSLETDSDRNTGVVALIQTGENNNTLVKVNYEGELIDHSQTNIFRSIACDDNTEALLDHPDHHELVKKAAQIVIEEEQNSGGQLGGAKGARLRTYERIKGYLQNHEMELDEFEVVELQRAIDEIYHNPLREAAKRRLNSMLNSKLTSDRRLVDVVLELYRDGNKLCLTKEEVEQQEPQLICSLGIGE